MKRVSRLKRHKRIKKHLVGTSDRPRLCVFRSSQHIYAQIIDDTNGHTLVSSCDLNLMEGLKAEKAFNVGKSIAKAALKKQIKNVIFDRGGFLYHGRVKALASGAREGGLKF